MSVVFMDGFDHLATAQLGLKWDTISGPVVVQSSPVRGFGGGGSLHFSDQSHWVRKMGLPADSTYILCTSLYMTAVPVDFEWVFYETAGQAHGSVRLGSSGNFTLYLGNQVSSQGASAGGLLSTINAWQFIEIKWVCHPTAGSVTIRVNGQQVYQLTNINTRGGATNLINGIGLDNPSSGGGGISVNIDDLFLLTSAGAANNDFIGDRRVATILPNGVGQYSEWARTGGSASGNYTAVNEATPDSDASYVAASVVGNRDSYAYQDLPAAVLGVTAVQFNLIAEKDDSIAVRTIQALERNGGVDATGTATADLALAYQDRFLVAETSLISAAAWTPAEINAAQFGVKVAS